MNITYSGAIATGSVTGTTAAMNIAIGFTPRYVKVINTNDGTNVEWFDSMTSGDGLLAKDHADAQFSVETSNYISQYTGLAANGALTGTAAVSATATITGTGTYFLHELSIGDFITIGGETRKVVAIASDTSLTVDVAFTITVSGYKILVPKGRGEGFTLGTATGVNTAHTLYWIAMS